MIEEIPVKFVEKNCFVNKWRIDRCNTGSILSYQSFVTYNETRIHFSDLSIKLHLDNPSEFIKKTILDIENEYSFERDLRHIANGETTYVALHKMEKVFLDEDITNIIMMNFYKK